MIDPASICFPFNECGEKRSIFFVASQFSLYFFPTLCYFSHHLIPHSIDSSVQISMSKKTTTKTTTTTTRTVSSGTSSKTASSSRVTQKSIIKGTMAVLALTAALSYSFVKDAVTDLGLLLPPIQPLNTAGCVAVPGLEACEDVHIHHKSGLAFTACGDSELRKSWFPPMAKLNASADPLAFQDKFIIYNLEVNQTPFSSIAEKRAYMFDHGVRSLCATFCRCFDY